MCGCGESGGSAKKPTPECDRGILAQAGHQMSEPAQRTSDTFF